MDDYRKGMEDRALLQILKALAEPQRFRMIQEITAAGELTCRELGERIRLAQPTISHHLKILHEAGLLAVRRESRHMFISVNQGLIQRILTSLPMRAGARRRAAP
ncbi:MAG TPA: metalloregulator ArsR/SmtB family transcription factor [Methylomirabilota bacterium]